LITAAAALTSRLVCSRRRAKEGGKNKRRANGEGIYNGWGEKRWFVYRRGKKVNGVLEGSWVRSTAAEPGSEKLTDVYSSALRRLREFANGRAADLDHGK
jgi:hypothetical protein